MKKINIEDSEFDYSIRDKLQNYKLSLLDLNSKEK